MKIKQITMREEDMKIKAVSGNDVTIDQGGQEIKTTTDALVPDAAHPGNFAMKPADPSQMKPGATVTSSDSTTSETVDDEEEGRPSERLSMIKHLVHTMGWEMSDLELLRDHELAQLCQKHQHREVDETHDDLISQGNNDVGGDATDSFINQVRDKKWERAQRTDPGARSTLPESDELMKWLTIAGIK